MRRPPGTDGARQPPTCRMSGVVDHLDARGRVILGSFYTPGKYVRLIGGWLLAHGVASSWTIADISCGYGAFFQLHGLLPGARFIANEIDREAVAQGEGGVSLCRVPLPEQPQRNNPRKLWNHPWRAPRDCRQSSLQRHHEHCRTRHKARSLLRD